MEWSSFNGGATIGQIGSESGVIVRDVEHPLGARITLERAGRCAAYAITCGIYGSMVHTRFFADEVEALQQFEAMEQALTEILKVEGDELTEAVERFMEQYP